MKSTLRKVLAVAMMAAMIACVGAGCAKNDNKTEQSSTTSTASQASTESKAEESKKEESKEESKKEESKEESKKEESKEESKEEPAVTAEELAGTYVVGAGSEVQAMLQINEDGTVAVQQGEQAMEGTWAAEGATVTITMADGDVLAYNYAEGTLTLTTDAAIVFVKQTGEQSDEPSENSTEEPGAYDAIVGVYSLTVDGQVAAAMQLNADMTMVLQDVTGVAKEGTWTVEEGKIAVTTDETLLFDFVDDTLVSVEQPDYVFVKQSAEQPTETSTQEPGAYDAIIGVYTVTAEGEVVAAMQLNDDFTAVVQFAEAKQGTWAVEEGKIVVTVDGEATAFDFVDNTLVNADEPDTVFVKQAEETTDAE